MTEIPLSEQIAAVRHALATTVESEFTGTVVVLPVHLVSAVLATLEAAQWRPIEEAPKDGTSILVWCGNSAEVAYWRNAKTNHGISGWYPNAYWKRPTHFRPLRPPPEDKP